MKGTFSFTTLCRFPCKYFLLAKKIQPLEMSAFMEHLGGELLLQDFGNNTNTKQSLGTATHQSL